MCIGCPAPGLPALPRPRRPRPRHRPREPLGARAGVSQPTPRPFHQCPPNPCLSAQDVWGAPSYDWSPCRSGLALVGLQEPCAQAGTHPPRTHTHPLCACPCGNPACKTPHAPAWCKELKLGWEPRRAGWSASAPWTEGRGPHSPKVSQRAPCGPLTATGPQTPAPGPGEQLSHPCVPHVGVRRGFSQHGGLAGPQTAFRDVPLPGLSSTRLSPPVCGGPGVPAGRGWGPCLRCLQPVEANKLFKHPPKPTHGRL